MPLGPWKPGREGCGLLLSAPWAVPSGSDMGTGCLSPLKLWLEALAP